METKQFLALFTDGFVALVRKIGEYYFRVNSKGRRVQLKRDEFFIVD